MNCPQSMQFGNAGKAGGRTDLELSASITSSIEVALSLLGDDARQTLVFYIAENFDLNQDRFSANPEVLGRALAKLLGTGAQVIESKIQQELNRQNENPGQREFAESLIWATKVELSFDRSQRGRMEDARQS